MLTLNLHKYGENGECAWMFVNLFVLNTVLVGTIVDIHIYIYYLNQGVFGTQIHGGTWHPYFDYNKLRIRRLLKHYIILYNPVLNIFSLLCVYKRKVGENFIAIWKMLEKYMRNFSFVFYCNYNVIRIKNILILSGFLPL